MKTARTLEAPAAAIVIVVLVLAPFIGGRDTLPGTAGLSIVALVAAAFLLWSREIVRPVALWPLAAFVALLGASAAVTASLHATIEQTLYFSGCAAAALVASSVFRGNRWFSAALLSFAGAGLLLGALGVREYKLSGQEWRVFTTFTSPGFFGGYLVLVVPVTLAAFLSSRSAAAAIGTGLAWGFGLAALLLTGTRFAVASGAAALIVFAVLVLWSRSFGRRQIGRLAVAACVAAVAVVLSLAPTAARVQGAVATQQSHSGPFRVATWRGTANIIRAHPLLGTGAGTFELVFPRYMVAGYTRMAHNGYLQIAAEAGVPALAAAAVAFLALLLAGVRGLKRQEEADSVLILPRGDVMLACGVIAALAGSLARNLLDSDIYNPGVGFSFWILAGLIAARGPARKPISLRLPVRVGITVLLGAMIAAWSLLSLGQIRSDGATTAWANGEPFSALELYRSAAAVDPLCADYWLRLGQIEAFAAGQGEGQWREGIAHIRRAARLEPTRARNVIVLGRVLAARGDAGGAIREFRRALVLDPHATPAMVAAARLSGGYEADRMYQRLLAEEQSQVERLRGVPELVNPDYAWAHYYFGKKDLKAGRLKDAAKHFRAAIRRLELRKSYKLYREAAREAGMYDPEEGENLDQLLADLKVALPKAERPQRKQ
jgi:O-antigen ligase